MELIDGNLKSELLDVQECTFFLLYLVMREMNMTPEQAKLFKELADHNIHRYDDRNNIYKYVDAETAKLILMDCSLKFSTPAELKDNDMELCLLNLNLNLKQLREKKITGLMNALMNNGGQTYKQAREFVKSKKGQEFLISMPTQDYKNILLQSYGSMHDVYRFFCATTSNCNPQMWENYAKNHTGVCIEYKFPTFFTSEYFAFKVYYDSEFKPFDFYDEKCKENLMSVYRWFYTKRERYKFEDEVRLVTSRKEEIFLFPQEIITGVYYGRETSQKDIEEIERLLIGYSFIRGQYAVY